LWSNYWCSIYLCILMMCMCLNNLCEGSRCIAPYLFYLCKLIDKFQNLLFYYFDDIGMNKSTLYTTVYLHLLGWCLNEYFLLHGVLHIPSIIYHFLFFILVSITHRDHIHYQKIEENQRNYRRKNSISNYYRQK
jgi:hypothetical protein